MSVPPRERVVEVVADLGEGIDPRWNYGSGLLIAGRTVLTAAHVVADAVAATVRGPDKRSHRAVLAPDWIGDPARLDLALLEVPDLSESVPAVPVVLVDRDVPSGDFVEGCWSVGYPFFQEVERDATGRSIRETAEVRGSIPPLSGLVEGLLSLQVTARPRELPSREMRLSESPWSGMSGAAVWAGNALVGVVAEHAERRGASDITVTPLEALASPDKRPTNAPHWWARIGVSDPSDLPRVPARRPEPTYDATLRVLKARTPELKGRKYELSQIASFAAGGSDPFGPGRGSDGYLWLVGEAWAGKTALLAEAVSSLPSEVDVVAYFLVARAAQASQEQFLAAVVPQLAWLLDSDPPAVVDVHAFWDLWARAAQHAETRGRHLLLVVDGLDEDLRSGGHSVAALLPTHELGRHARVLVASRAHLEPPEDVDAHHPLRTTSKVTLAKSRPGEQLRVLAEQEIAALLASDHGHTEDPDLAFEVLGLLTAAAGGLAVNDLGTMTHRKSHTVRTFIARRAGRTLEPVGPQEERRYRFAHETLREFCERHPDVGGDPQYRVRLHEWAHQWGATQWPAGDIGASSTPSYLLDSYPAILAGDSEHPAGPANRQRLAALVTDVRWVETGIRRVGVDLVLASLRDAVLLLTDQASVVAMLRLLEEGSRQLGSTHPVSQAGYVATILAWEALRSGRHDLAHALADRLEQYPAPQLVPTWTTERTSAHLLRVLGRHDDHVTAVAVATDGRVVSGSVDGAVRLWDPATPNDLGRELTRYEFGGVNAVAVAPDGRVVCGGGFPFPEIRLLDPANSDDPARVLGSHDGGVHAVAVAADGRVVSGGGDFAVRLWDPATPDDPGRELGRHDRDVHAVAVAADGRVVSGGSDGAVRLWDPAALDEPGRELGRHEGRVRSVAVAANGRVVSGGEDFAVRLWDPAVPDDSGRELGRHDNSVEALAVTADGRVVSAGSDGAVRLWDPATPDDPGRELGRHDHDSSVNGVAVAAGLIVSGGSDGALRLWDPATTDDFSRTGGRHSLELAVAVTPDGRVVSGEMDGPVRLWDPAAPSEPSRELGRHDGWAVTVAVAADGRVVSGGSDFVVRLWDPAAPDDRGRELGRHDGWAFTVAVATDGRVVSGGNDGLVRLWDPAAPDDHGEELGRHDDSVEAVAVTADGRVVSGGRDGAVRLWDPGAPDDPGQELGRHDHDDWVEAVAVTADGRVVSAGRDNAVRLWDPATPDDPGRELGYRDHRRRRVNAVAVTAGLLLSGGEDGALRLGDLAAPDNPFRELTRHDDPVEAVAVNAHGQIAVLTGRGITVFQMTSEPASYGRS